MPQIQISVDDDLDQAIRKEAKRERLTISSYTRRLLVQALKDAGVRITVTVPENQLPLLSEVEMN